MQYFSSDIHAKLFFIRQCKISMVAAAFLQYKEINRAHQNCCSMDGHPIFSKHPLQGRNWVILRGGHW